MKIPFSDLKKGFENKHYKFSAKDLKLNSIFFSHDIIDFYLSVISKNDEFQIDGILHSKLLEKCDRCLDGFINNCKFPLKVLLSNRKNSDNHFDVIPFNQLKEFFNFRDIIREIMIIERPFKTLCKNDCNGLCKECGKNLNKTQCKCESKSLNSPWEKLKNL